MTAESDPAAAQRLKRYGLLPTPIRAEDTFPGHETQPARDPEGGVDTDRDFTLWHAGG